VSSPLKATLGVIATLLILAVLAWTGTFLYWHFKIRAAIRSVASPNPSYEEGELLKRAGCRALPYLVDSLPESKNQFYLMSATYMIAAEVAAPGTLRGNVPYQLLETRSSWIVQAEDGGPGLQSKLEEIRAYWRENGHRHHQWWRVWSSSCGAR